MKRVFLAFFIFTTIAALAARADWRGFRGSDQSSVAKREQIPTSFSDQENMAWKIDLPGRGPASPIVVGDRVLVTASSGASDDRLHVLCFSAKDGSKLWHRQFWATGRTFCHPSSSNASCTPASDGECVYAFFSSNDMVCLDLNGNFRWFRGLAFDYPLAGNDVGMSCSPVVVDETVVVQVECQGNSFATGLDRATGKTRWHRDRPPVANWSSPLVAELGSDQTKAVILQGERGITAVEPRSGKVIWEFAREGVSAIPSSCVADGKLIVPCNGILALSLNGREKPTFAWDSTRLRPSTCSPVVYNGRVYTISGSGILKCANLSDGSEIWEKRIKAPVWSTPVIADNHLYVLNGQGLAQVVDLSGQRGVLVSTFDFAATLQASAAVADGAYYVRSDKNLWKISAEKE
jgi:outer membrane protein assembly factor BamB